MTRGSPASKRTRLTDGAGAHVLQRQDDATETHVDMTVFMKDKCNGAMDRGILLLYHVPKLLPTLLHVNPIFLFICPSSILQLPGDIPFASSHTEVPSSTVLRQFSELPGAEFTSLVHSGC